MSEATAKKPELNMSVWFDVRCPWCFLGKRRLEVAIERFASKFPDVPVLVEHHSFELAPSMPDRFEGDESEYLLRYEGVPLNLSARQLPALEELAQAEGVDLAFGHLKHGNTRRAHRVFQYGKHGGLGEETLEALFRGFFSEGLDMSEPETLGALAASAGLDEVAARDAAESEEWDDAIRRDHVRAQMLGSNGVPFALINAKYSVSGAREPEILESAFEKVLERDFGIFRSEE